MTMSFKPEKLTKLTRVQEIINRVVNEMGIPKNDKESDAMAERLRVELELLEDDNI